MYHVYVLENQDDHSWYIGYTGDLDNRMKAHLNGYGCRTTALKKNWKLIYSEMYLLKDDATGREIFLKGGSGRNYLKKQLRHYLAKNGNNDYIYMSPENFQKPPQQSSEFLIEIIPTEEDVRAIFKQLIGADVDFKEVRTRTDEKGLYLWDVKIKREDGEAEYSYMRKGHYPEGQALHTAIHVVFYDGDGTPTGGESVARFENGTWKIL